MRLCDGSSAQQPLLSSTLAACLRCTAEAGVNPARTMLLLVWSARELIAVHSDYWGSLPMGCAAPRSLTACAAAPFGRRWRRWTACSTCASRPGRCTRARGTSLWRATPPRPPTGWQVRSHPRPACTEAQHVQRFQPSKQPSPAATALHSCQVCKELTRCFSAPASPVLSMPAAEAAPDRIRPGSQPPPS